MAKADQYRLMVSDRVDFMKDPFIFYCTGASEAMTVLRALSEFTFYNHTPGDNLEISIEEWSSEHGLWVCISEEACFLLLEYYDTHPAPSDN